MATNWKYAQQTLGIQCSWNAFQAWWKAQPEHDEVVNAKMHENCQRAAAVQQARRARGVMPDMMLAAPTDPEREVRWPVHGVSDETRAVLEAKLKARTARKLEASHGETVEAVTRTLVS
jgi:hypothetical protein